MKAKAWWKSKTIRGIAAMAGISFAALFGVDLSDLHAEISRGLFGLGLFLASAYAVYGRFKASQPLSK